jgi:hypothetical protein
MYKNNLQKSFAFAAYLFLIGAAQVVSAAPDGEYAAAPTNACEIPTKPAASTDETAWQIFVAINCKIKNGQLTWETWKTQACLNNPDDCKTRRLHDSMLRLAITKLAKPNNPRRTGGCAPMTTATTADKLLAPFVPKNLSSNPQFCEDYANSKGLLTKSGQVKYLQSGGTISFPTGAIEVKADWVAATSYTGVTFDCTSPNTTVYQEKIGGSCYALAGIHISSKLFPNWLWATFEPQDPRTNPNRCNPKLYNACIDAWGSKPAESSGTNTEITPALSALFDKAGAALDLSFKNYRLTGTQTDYNQPAASKGNLGNSFVEFNAQVDPQQASCITCHNYAQRTTVAMATPPPKGTPVGSTPPGSAPTGSASVGIPTPLPAAYQPLDFSWFLGFGVPDGPKKSK